MPIQPSTRAGEPAAADRRLVCRVHERRACEVPGSCKPTSGPQSNEVKWAATILDLSPGGIRLALPRRFEPGASLEIELAAKAGEEPCTVVARVVYARPQKGAGWALGCHLVSELSEEEIRRLLHAPGRPAPRGRGARTIEGVRFRLCTTAGTLLDCLIRRLTIPGDWPLPAGKVLSLSAFLPGRSLPPLQFEVVRCEADGGRWVLEGRLPEAPSADLVRALRSRRTPGGKKG
jgi:hypothetical protein